MKHKSLLLLLLSSCLSFAQTNHCNKIDKELVADYNKVFPFYYGDNDSLIKYSNAFITKITNHIGGNPQTIKCPFKALDSINCPVVTSADGLFRIYTWDTFQGGTMHLFNNIFQYTANNKTHTKNVIGTEVFGSYFNDVYTLHTNNKTIYLAIGMNSLSSAEYVEFINLYTIEGNNLNDSIALIKTRNNKLGVYKAKP